jgi:general secretion pathway protein M
MIVRVRNWYTALTRREQVMVGSAGAIAALVVVVYGIVLPLGTALDDAALRHSAAVERSGRLLAQVEALKVPAPKAAAAAGPVDQQVAASAEAAGFVLQSNQPRGADVTVIVVPTARASAALGWLDSLAAQGVVVDTLTMTPAADGSVSVKATLRRPGA